MSDGVTLSLKTLALFSATTRAEIFSFLNREASIADRSGQPVETGIARDDDTSNDDTEGPADLSTAQARKFLERVSDKVRDALRMIVETDPSSGIEWSAMQDALGSGNDMRGITGGITKRVRTILGDPEARLIWWTPTETGWIGHVSAMTHRSLRRALGLS